MPSDQTPLVVAPKLRAEMVEKARYHIDKTCTGGSPEDFEAAELIVADLLPLFGDALPSAPAGDELDPRTEFERVVAWLDAQGALVLPGAGVITGEPNAVVDRFADAYVEDCAIAAADAPPASASPPESDAREACVDAGGHWWPPAAREDSASTCMRCGYNPGWVGGGEPTDLAASSPPEKGDEARAFVQSRIGTGERIEVFDAGLGGLEGRAYGESDDGFGFAFEADDGVGRYLLWSNLERAGPAAPASPGGEGERGLAGAADDTIAAWERVQRRPRGDSAARDQLSRAIGRLRTARAAGEGQDTPSSRERLIGDAVYEVLQSARDDATDAELAAAAGEAVMERLRGQDTPAREELPSFRGEGDTMREWALPRASDDDQDRMTLAEYVERHYPGGVQGFRRDRGPGR